MTVVDTLKVRLELINRTTQSLLQVAKNIERLEQKMEKFNRVSAKVTEQQTRTTAEVHRTVDAVGRLQNAFLSLGAIYASINITQQILDTSDALTMATGRLSLLTDNVMELRDQIYQMSQETRVNFLDMLSTVTKMGINVGVGPGEWFENTDELVKFNELVAKTFAIGGQNTKEIGAAMLQLTQALSSGRLQGDEFRSLFENSPLYVKYIGEYLGEIYGATDELGNSIALSNGQLKELGAQGLLTSDVLIDAMFYAADEINEKFESVPRTFAQRFEQIKNILVQQGQNLLETINNVVDNESFDKFLGHLTNQMTLILGIIDSVLTAISPLIQFVLSHWNIMAPLLMTIAGAMTILIIKTELSADTFLAHEIAVRKDAFALKANQLVTQAYTTTLNLLKIAHLKLAAAEDINSRIRLSVITITKRQNMESKITAFLLKNEALGNLAVAISSRIYAAAQGEGVIASLARIATGKLNIVTFAQEATAAGAAAIAVNLLNAALMFIVLPVLVVIGVIWVIIKVLNHFGGTSYTVAGVLIGTLAVAASIIADAFILAYNSVARFINLFKRNKIEYIDYIDPTEQWKNWNDKFSNKSSFDYSLEAGDYSSILNDDLMAGIDGILENTGDIANNTSMTNDDISFLRALAENRVITRMNAINVNITNNNEMNVNSDMDLDGVVQRITDSLYDAVSNNAKGVHI